MYGPLGRAVCVLRSVEGEVGVPWGLLGGGKNGEGKEVGAVQKKLVGLYSRFVKTLTGDQRLSCAGSVTELCTVRCSIATWEPGWPCFEWYC